MSSFTLRSEGGEGEREREGKVSWWERVSDWVSECRLYNNRELHFQLPHRGRLLKDPLCVSTLRTRRQKPDAPPAVSLVFSIYLLSQHTNLLSHSPPWRICEKPSVSLSDLVFWWAQCVEVCMSLEVVISSPEECFCCPTPHTGMRLKIRVRRMKEARELRGVYGAHWSQPALHPLFWSPHGLVDILSLIHCLLIYWFLWCYVLFWGFLCLFLSFFLLLCPCLCFCFPLRMIDWFLKIN